MHCKSTPLGQRTFGVLHNNLCSSLLLDFGSSVRKINDCPFKQ
jgi:hypothetical protein